MHSPVRPSARIGDPLVARMRAFGTTVFAEMSELAARTGALNLGQGFPDTDGPDAMLDAAVEALRRGANQYSPGQGDAGLRLAIADHQREWWGLDHDPDSGVLVTAGATEAIAATVLALCEPGDEVICFEPFYDSYAACIALAGAVRHLVTLHAEDFAGDITGAIEAVQPGPRARLLLLNSPHNPTGKVFSRRELEAIAKLCREHDLIAVTDEVYEHLVFDGARHVPLATFPGMRERTVTISSAGKTFSCTGWKVGWLCAASPLVDAVAKVKQFLTFTNAAPLQPAVATALRLPRTYFTDLATTLAAKRDRLCAGLEAAGFIVHPPAGTFYVTAEISSFGAEDGVTFCRRLPERCGVVAVPVGAFYDDQDAGRTLIRFAFCKKDTVLEEAVSRLARLG